jgi:hypothetical protein
MLEVREKKKLQEILVTFQKYLQLQGNLSLNFLIPNFTKEYFVSSMFLHMEGEPDTKDYFKTHPEGMWCACTCVHRVMCVCVRACNFRPGKHN